MAGKNFTILNKLISSIIVRFCKVVILESSVIQKYNKTLTSISTIHINYIPTITIIINNKINNTRETIKKMHKN